MNKNNKNEMMIDVISNMGRNLVDMRNDRKYEIEKIDEFIKKLTKVYRYVEDAEESLRKAKDLQKKVVLMGCEISNLNDTIKKYQKALELAVYDKVFAPGCCSFCPSESDCDKENTTAIDCRAKFMDRWKTSAGIGVIDPARIVK